MKEFKHLTKKESEELCFASSDLETGNYLIRERTNEHMLALQELLDAIHAKDPDDRQKEIVEWHKACSDYYYAKHNGYLDNNDHFLEIKWKFNEE